MSDEFCTCSDQGLEPFWYEFPDRRIGCKRCRLPQGYLAVQPIEPDPPPEENGKRRRK
jgi:hypothetical protein